ncbi:MAG: PhoU family transcriptional regulator [Candidatus Hadarchaeum yellowstonense]|jgi:phosphate transport system protein|uniref:Phosphate-specific transport system accessory protein PhoU n=1 Tax=Hadarchaeum yellowstonense TaxID=1776334 RepID=A0A147JWK6_HADYE|nr:MAG: PhoU family transcriptional regulator [Candidatus Hadarchaeum yellowstonense]
MKLETRRKLSEELEDLKSKTIKMSSLAAAAVERAVRSLARRNVGLAKRVIKEDDKIDALELEIENKCMHLIALQQPMAKDLRIIGSCLKIITDLERVGDRAADIANITVELAGRPLVKPLVDIPRMAELAVGMLRDAMRAFKEENSLLAWGLGERDDEVDRLAHQVTRELFSYLVEDPRKTSDAFRLMLVASFLERIADHATNIGERVIYMERGERVKIN